MKAFILFLGALLSISAFSSSFSYEGKFQQEQFDKAPCDGVFYVRSYTNKIYFTGPSGLTTVLNFTSEHGLAFFQDMNIVGRKGGSGDIAGERTWESEAGQWQIAYNGIIDKDFLLYDIRADLFKNGKLVCSATAEFSGFKR